MNRKGIYVANPGQSEAKIDGDRNIGREVAESMRPDVVVCPTNNGTHFIGVMRGINEKGLHPMAIAATAIKTKVADSIGGFHRYEGRRWEESVGQTGARIVDVDDGEIMQALRVLLEDGIVAEPAAASGIAALRKAKLPSDTVACCTITGNGMKFPRLLKNRAKRMFG
jgi:threonine synthase